MTFKHIKSEQSSYTINNKSTTAPEQDNHSKILACFLDMQVSNKARKTARKSANLNFNMLL